MEEDQFGVFSEERLKEWAQRDGLAFRLGSGPGRIGHYAIDTGDVRLLPRTREFLARVELNGAREAI